MKALKHFKENKIFYVTFGMLLLISFEYLCKKEIIHCMDNYYYPLYVINYDCGYSSRLLVGAIFSLFFGESLNPYNLIYTLIIIYVAACFVLSLFINSCIKHTKYNSVAIYSLFIIASPAMLAYLRYLGTLDLFWIFLVIASLWAVDKKGFRWLVPIFCVISLAVYELFVTTYLPIMAIVVFYQFAKKPNVSNFIYIAVCALVVGFAAVYFLLLGDSTMKMTSDEMLAFARGRVEAPGTDFDEFYLRSVFFWELPEVESYHGFAGYIQYNYDYFTSGQEDSLKQIGFFLFSCFASAIPYTYLMAKSLKKAESPLKKFIFICSFAPFLLVVINLLLSTDTDRFAMHFLLSTLMLVLFFIKENDQAFSESFDEATLKVKDNKTVFACVALAVALTVFVGVKF